MENLFKEYEGVFVEKTEVSEKKDKPEKFFAYSPFALQDALGEKNIKKIWLEYQKLIIAEVEPEDLIHKIISKIKDMVAIQKGSTASDLGIKDYPFSKSKQHTKNWKAEDLQNFYTKLITIYHQSRMGGEDLSLAVEKALLGL